MADWDDGGWLTLSNERPKARKGHDCDECGRRIAPGEVYHRVSGISEGDCLYSNKACAHCCAAQDWLVAQCGGYVFTLVLDDLRDHLAELVAPGYQIRLLRLIIGMERQWQRFDGQGLMPVPPPLPKRIRSAA